MTCSRVRYCSLLDTHWHYLCELVSKHTMVVDAIGTLVVSSFAQCDCVESIALISIVTTNQDVVCGQLSSEIHRIILQRACARWLSELFSSYNCLVATGHRWRFHLHTHSLIRLTIDDLHGWAYPSNPQRLDGLRTDRRAVESGHTQLLCQHQVDYAASAAGCLADVQFNQLLAM